MELVASVGRIFGSQLGMSVFSVDAVTVAGASRLLVTELKGEMARFHAMHSLADKTHATEAEANAVAITIRNAQEQGATRAAATFVDNAALALVPFLQRLLQNQKMIVGRDPGHCVDLYNKDLVEVGGPFAKLE